eukprot:TRINITY_DN752_c0_g1_i1.p1 TRINITY_DN752_c0_g1~~TRINITY_DN752_c0_g1_i1.p1  ORF type:complete len:258 (+),score=86.33 TRINITY_DN752_c0_g1_i1:176-949(+)
MDEKELQAVLRWIDLVPLSRPKKNISRDFADGVLMSEVVHHFFPKMIDLHNYSKSNSFAQKKYNWETLNQKVFRRMGFALTNEDIKDVVDCKPGTIIRVLKVVQSKLAEYQKKIDSGEVVIALEDPSEKSSSSPSQSPLRTSEKKAFSSSSSSSSSTTNSEHKILSSSSSSSYPMVSSSSSSASLSSPTVAASFLSTAANDKQQMIADLRETVDILTLKVEKLEELLKLKNIKIASLQAQLKKYEDERSFSQQQQLV